MLDRRSFVAVAAGLAPVPSFAPQAIRRLAEAEAIAAGRPAAALAEDEAYWSTIQRAFDLDRTMLNFNNGGVCPTPTHVLEQMIRDLRFSNELPVHHMWTVLEPRLESVRRELAADFGCDPEELAIVRNASEANETMILGLDLRRGDEVICSNQNYGRMLTTWEQRVRRDGIVLRQISFEVPSGDDHVLERFLSAVTPRTKAIEITHITNLTGQILPVRRLVEAVRPKGIAVFVDGAHAYAHFPFTRDELGCDYYGTSLHKWLLAPVGTGFLYVRRERIRGLWPLMGAPATMDADIRKYEEIGTHPAANHNAIAAALVFHRGIGAARKVARLRWLRDRWIANLRERTDRVRILTPLEEGRSGAIALFAADGVDPVKFSAHMLEKHRIVCTPIVHPEFEGIRVTPNVYSTPDECDRFAETVALVLKTAGKAIAQG
jgi:selenocysteine lyase/cysteine desulfurase